MHRILIVATTSYAGMGPYVAEIVNSFSGEEPIFFFFHDYEDNYFYKNIKRSLHQYSVFFKQPNSKGNKVREMLTGQYGYEHEIIQICHEKQIEVVHFINSPGTSFLYRKLSHVGIKVLGTIHDLHPHEACKAVHKLLRQYVSRIRMSHTITLINNLVTNAHNQESELKSQFPLKNIFFHDFPSLVTEVIRNGKEAPIELKNKDFPYILFFGRIEAYKGVNVLIEAFRKLEKWLGGQKLIIAGKGDMHEIIEKDENILFINRYIKDSEIRYLYEHATCVVYPYISATQSGVLSLSSYFQVPVIASDIPFFSDVVEKENMGVLFKNGDAEDLVNKMRKLLADNFDVSVLKSGARQYYDNHFKKEIIRRQLLRIYNNICEK